MSSLTRRVCAAAIGVAMGASCARPSANAPATWSPAAAASYLDRRADWWMQWRDASRDRGTFCISCHTTLPYALARPASAGKRALLRSVQTRVTHWADMPPYYGAHQRGSAKAVESRATEAILNALILADADARTGTLSEDTRSAFDHMWALQRPDGQAAGAWPWLQFGLDPWEGENGEYYGAVLAALAVATAPQQYASTPAIQPQLTLLRAYLDREFTAQPLANRTVLLWASTRRPGLLNDDRRRRLAADLRRAQQADGGWSLERLSGRARWWDPRRLAFRSDGYATGLVVLALTGTTGAGDEPVARGRAWLESHQNAADGSWPGYSLNTLESPSDEVARFMNDAATAYAVLALDGRTPQVR